MKKHKKTKHLALSVHGGCLALFLATVSAFSVFGGVSEQQVSAPTEEPVHSAAPETVTATAPLAAIIDQRLKNQNLPSPGLAELTRAITHREELTARSVMITLVPDEASGKTPIFLNLKLSEHPEWVRLRQNFFSADFVVDPVAVQQSLDANTIHAIPMQVKSAVTATKLDNKNVLRATTTGTAKPGYAFDTAAAAQQIANAFMNDEAGVKIDAVYSEPSMTVTLPDGSTKTLELLGTGISDFAGSPRGRVHNVLKAMDERMQNVVIPAGSTFSTVAALDAPITLEKGWVEEMGLFGGSAAMTVGAGICQSATTVYRAALLAGLPIIEKRNHSLFVDHYEMYGVGLDATIFPNVHDLRFQNDTGEDIVMQAYTEGDTAYVRLYGKKDGRTATLDGPYFASSKQKPAQIGGLTGKQIAWVRTMTYANGDSVKQPIYATYAKPFWSSISRKYAAAEGMKLLLGGVVAMNK